MKFIKALEIIQISSISFDSAQDTIWPPQDRDIPGYGDAGYRYYVLIS